MRTYVRKGGSRQAGQPSQRELAGGDDVNCQHYPFYTERMLQHAILSGQRAAAQQLFENLFKALQKSCPSVRTLKSDAIHLTVFLIRKCMQAGLSSPALDNAVLYYTARLAEAHSSAAIRLLLLEMIEQLLRLTAQRDRDSRTAKVQRAVEYVHARARMALTLEDVAEVVGLSYSYFSRTFAEVTGMTFRAYLTHIRLSHAKELLLTTDRKVGDIAAAVGFEDPSHFIRVFKRCTGMTPRQYARAHQSARAATVDAAAICQ